MKNIVKSFLLVALIVAVSGISPALAAEKVSVLRIGTPAGSYGKPLGAGQIGFIQAKNLFEEEFKNDGITVEWNFIKATGPGINEALSNNSIDIGSLGDLPAIAGKAGGLKTRLVAVSSRGGNTYVVVPADSNIKTIKDLKGKKIGVNLGTYMHAALLKIIKDAGLTANDFKLVNADIPTLKTAIATKDVDAAFINSDALSLRSRGVGRIIHTTNDDPVFYQQAGSVIVRDDFAKKHPDIVRRFVKVWVKASHLASQNKAATLKLNTRNGSALADLKEDTKGQSVAYTYSPLFDEHFINHYKKSIALYKEHKLIRKTFDPETEWIDRSYLDAALKDLKLENYWPEFDANGNPKKK
jgi:sulfonate transport system substrate-binding protein